MTTLREERIGGQRLILGDCMDVLSSIAFDSVVTDPPYGIAYKSGYATDALWKGGRTILQDETVDVRDLIAAAVAPAPCLMFGTWRAPRPAGTKMVLIWDKGGALGMGDLSIPWKPDHEEIYVMGKGFIGSRDSGSVLRCPPVQSMAKNGRVHPTQKPVALMEKLIAKVPGRVLDPFMGSGTTLVACQKLGRQGTGIELDPDYFDIACKRVDEASRQPDMFVTPTQAPATQEVLL